jgi:hypothetical protein
MAQLVALALLPSGQDALARLVRQPHAAPPLHHAISRQQLAAIDQAQRPPVRQHRPQFRHQIER